MQYFAHNGVSHQSAVEAASHSAGQIIMIGLLVTAAAIGFMIGAIWLLKRVSLVEIPNNDKEDV
jgi:flagellar biogenesis protein FliO